MARTKQNPRLSLGRKSAPGPEYFRELRKQRYLTPLHHAAIGGKVSILSALLTGGRADIDRRDGDRCTALHHAVRNNHPGAVEFLLAHGASVSAKDYSCCTPLAFAAQQGQVEISNLLLDKGASVSSVCRKGRTPLHYASRGGHLAVAQILLGKGASMTAQDKRLWTALDYSVDSRHWEIVQLLLKEGRQRWALSQSQRQPLELSPDIVDEDALVLELRDGSKTNRNKRFVGAALAAYLGFDHLLVRLFNEHGCHPDAGTWGQGVPRSRGAPLVCAAENGHQGCVKILLGHGANLGDMPLVIAAENGHQGCIEVLLAHGADINGVAHSYATPRGGGVPLACAAESGHQGCVEILLAHGANVDGVESSRAGTTRKDVPLARAAENGHQGCVEVLLAHGADVNGVESSHGTTRGEGVPLARAAEKGHQGCVKILLAHGADVNGVESSRAGTTRKDVPLARAAENGHQGCVEVLLAHGADVNGVECSHGTTRGEGVPLARAAEKGHQGCVKILLAYGADVSGAKGLYASESPLECALRRRHDDIAGMLLDAGASPLFDHLDPNSPPTNAVMLLAERGPTVAAELLSRISSLALLSVWLLEIAASKDVTLVKEYFRIVAPSIRENYSYQPDLPPAAKLIHLLLKNQGTLSTTSATKATSARSRTSSETNYSQEIQRTIVAAFDWKFIGVFFLLAVVDGEVLTEILTDLPWIRERAQRMLPSLLHREADEELISRLAQVGYNLPLRPPPTFHDLCELGSAHEVRRWLQTEGRDMVNVAGLRHRTALHIAAQAGHLEVVKLLVEYGASLTAKTYRGSTAENLADQRHREAVAAFLKAEREKLSGAGPGAGKPER